MNVVIVWLAVMLILASIVLWVIGVRLLINLYESDYYKPKMRKQRDTV